MSAFLRIEWIRWLAVTVVLSSANVATAEPSQNEWVLDWIEVSPTVGALITATEDGSGSLLGTTLRIATFKWGHFKFTPLDATLGFIRLEEGSFQGAYLQVGPHPAASFSFGSRKQVEIDVGMSVALGVASVEWLGRDLSGVGLVLCPSFQALYRTNSGFYFGLRSQVGIDIAATVDDRRTVAITASIPIGWHF